MEKVPKPLSLYKRILFNSLMLFGIYGAVEFMSFLTLLRNHGSLSALIGRRRVAASQDPFNPAGPFEAPMAVHPYIGTVLTPGNNDGQSAAKEKYRITEFGFVDDDLPIHHRSPDRVIVGILGGSVARQFSLNATDALSEELSKSSEFHGRSFKFVRLATNAYKQPQQLMTLTYVLMLGGEFDIVINLDGFNEATLPAADNIPFGIFSAYPCHWGAIVSANAIPELMRRGGYISHLRKRQHDEAASASTVPWCYSPTAQLLWGFRDERSSLEIVRQINILKEFRFQKSSYTRSGPPEHFDSQDEMYAHCTDLWSRSSLLIHQLCEARGIRYFHFLQPNQYLDGSKPMGDVETKRSIQRIGPFCQSVQSCFPLMKAAGTRLVASGVSFTDLTDVFADHPEPIYIDNCCHLEKSGDLILANAIGERIRAASR